MGTGYARPIRPILSQIRKRTTPAARQRWRNRYAKIARRAGAVAGGKVERRIERHLLTSSWANVKPAQLRNYLVRDYQSPVINPQSILARHLLVREALGKGLESLMDEELAWATEKNRRLVEHQRVLQTQTSKPWSTVRNSKAWRDLFAEVMDDAEVFAERWSTTLGETTTAARVSVIEAACGSANDYRFLDSYGVAPLIDYTGFDLTQANVDNASQMFPKIDFRLGDVLEIDAADGSYDWAIAHDLLEHLSPAVFERAIHELCRVARRGVLVSFFLMHDMPEHKIETRRMYHFNDLSKPRTDERFARYCATREWTHISPMLAERYGFKKYYNPPAWTLIARK